MELIKMGIDFDKLVGGYVLAQVQIVDGKGAGIQIIRALEEVPGSNGYMYRSTELPQEPEDGHSETGRQTPDEMLNHRYRELMEGWEHWEVDTSKRAVERDKKPSIYERMDSAIATASGMVFISEDEEPEIYDANHRGFYKPAKKDEFDFVETDKEMGIVVVQLERMLKLPC